MKRMDKKTIHGSVLSYSDELLMQVEWGFCFLFLYINENTGVCKTSVGALICSVVRKHMENMEQDHMECAL